MEAIMDKKCNQNCEITDLGNNPTIVNIDALSMKNQNFRTTLWTGKNSQVTLMSIPPCSDIGVEMHPNVDQFLRIEAGTALVQFGECKERLIDQRRINCCYAIMIPAGTWHNIVNVGNTPLKLYSVYAPPQHPAGTIHQTKEIAKTAEKH